MLLYLSRQKIKNQPFLRGVSQFSQKNFIVCNAGGMTAGALNQTNFIPYI
jgi:hypothetical protein